MNIVEIDVYGVYLTALLAVACASYLVLAVLRRVLDRTGFYNLVWHRALFDIALLVIIIGVLITAVDPGEQLLRDIFQSGGSR